MREVVEAIRGAFPQAEAREEAGGVRIEIEEAEVQVRIRDGEMDLRLCSVRWDGPHTPVAVTRRWKKVGLAGRTAADLVELVRAAAAARRRQYRVCPYCGEAFPPEHRIEGDVCHGCAAGRMGVVF